MKTQLLALALAGSSLMFGAGCNLFPGGDFLGCDALQTTDYQAVSFTPSSVVAHRISSTCGAPSATYAPSDTLSLDLIGETDVPPPYTAMTFEIAMSELVGQSIPLTVTTPSGSDGTTPTLQTAADSQSLVQFSLATGSNANEIDASPINAMTITVESLPSSDGEPLVVSVKIFFLDGSDLSATYQAPVTTAESLCVDAKHAAAPKAIKPAAAPEKMAGR